MNPRNFYKSNTTYPYSQGSNRSSFRINQKFILIALIMLSTLVVGAASYLMLNNRSSSTKRNNETAYNPFIPDYKLNPINGTGTPLANNQNQSTGQVLGARSYKKCYNTVISQNGRYFWKDECKGDPNKSICLGGPQPLDQNDMDEFLSWVRGGMKRDELDPRCY